MDIRIPLLDLLLCALLSLNSEALVAREQPETPFRIAWLTDTHVGTDRGAHDLAQVVALINRYPGIGQVIVSGDITEMDMGDNLQTAKNILDSLEVPYAIIPGNHDTKWSASGGANFARYFGEDRFDLTLNGVRFLGLHQGPVLRMGPGFIAPEDLAWLDSTLQAMDDPDQPLFIINHYPMNASVSNWMEEARIMEGRNVQAILHGHGHRNRVTEYAGIPGIMSRATISHGSLAAGCTLMELDADSIYFSEITLRDPKPRRWHSQALVLRPVPHLDEAEPEPHPTSLRWRWDSGELMTAAPVVTSSLVIAASTSGQVQALRLSDGEPVWSRRLRGSFHGSPLVVGERVILGSSDSLVVCLGLSDGQRQWERRVPGAVLSTPQTDGKRIFIGCGENLFLALDLNTGETVWEYHGISGYVETKPLLADGSVLFGAWDEGFHALNRNTGQENWVWRGGRQGILYSPATCWPISNGRHAFFTAPDRVLTAVDLESGQTVWRSARHRVRESIGINTAGDVGFARCMWDTVFAFSTDGETADILWETDLQYGFDIDPSMPVERRGLLWIAAQNGKVYVLQARSGKLLERISLSTDCLNTPIPFGRRSAIVSGWDGVVHRIDLPRLSFRRKIQ